LQAYSGGPASGLPGHDFQNTYYETSLGSGGHIAFYGATSDGTTSLSGVWTGRPDELQPVALQGSIAPNANARFGSFFRNTPAVNRFGQIAFPAGPRTGTMLEVAQGDVRTISSLAMLTNHGDDDGRPRGMNDLGQVAFHATFTDGSRGIFLSDAVAHLPGDYNDDAIVDAGDYVVWRKSLITQNLIADGDRDGVVGEGDYTLWKDFFGLSLPLDTGSGAVASVPEPAMNLFYAVMSGLPIRYRRRYITKYRLQLNLLFGSV
jgi:hypothetical protein